LLTAAIAVDSNIEYIVLEIKKMALEKASRLMRGREQYLNISYIETQHIMVGSTDCRTVALGFFHLS
jgi:hypothetical protein